MRRMRRFILIIPAALLAACGGSSEDEAAKTTPLISTTIDTEAELLAAQEAYLEIAAVTNAVLEIVYDAYPGNVPWAEMPALCATLAQASEQFAVSLRDFEGWPVDSQNEIDAAIESSLAEAGLLSQCAGLPGTEADLSTLWSRIHIVRDEANDAASAVRIALKLPLDL